MFNKIINLIEYEQDREVRLDRALSQIPPTETKHKPQAHRPHLGMVLRSPMENHIPVHFYCTTIKK